MRKWRMHKINMIVILVIRQKCASGDRLLDKSYCKYNGLKIKTYIFTFPSNYIDRSFPIKIMCF